MAHPLARKSWFAFLALASAATAAWGDPQAWTSLPQMPAEVAAGPEWVRPTKFAAWRLSDIERLRAVLRSAPMEKEADEPDQPVPVEIAIPKPDGGFSFFAIVEAPVMEPGLAIQFPEIKTYRGQGLDDPSSNIRLDLTPQGFHASVLGPNGSYYVDPYTQNDTVHYASYFIQDLGRQADGHRCYTQDDGNQSGQNPDGFEGGYGERASGTTLRTFQLAMAGTAEYTAFHGGTVALGQAAIVTGVNRVTQVWENECSIRFTLVANNNLLVYTDPNTDPYTNSDVVAMLDENDANCDLVIGTANYDVGHVVGRANLGGVAQLGVVCGNSRARGATALNSPTGDFFWVSYVCHEMGHQFSATHSFNSNTSPCIENRSAGTAYEPGGGTTIMAYSGICGADNIISQSNPYFHTKSYDQILAHATSRTCDTESATGNSVPSANAGADKVIPLGTAFEVTGTSADANGDTLSYCWEQIDLGAAQTLAEMNATDNGTSPIFRSFTAVASPSRTFPRLTDVLDGSLSLGERYPGAARTMDLRFTVRDSRSGGGGVNADTVILTVNAASGPFQVTSPNSNVSLSGAQTVTWNVANTNVSPVSTATVDILLSTDGGATFPTVLAAGTPNDGTQSITLPSLNSTTARIKIKAVNNYYFDISNTNFTITCPTVIAPTGVAATDGVQCDRVSVTWNAVAGAADYEVFRGTGPVGAVATSIGTSLTTSFDDFTAPAGSTFYYFVKARTACASSGFNSFDTGFRGGTSSAPTGLTASDSTSCTEVSLSWNTLIGATSYRVVRNTVNDSATATLVGTTADTTLSDTSGTPGVPYFYFVRGETASCGSGPYSASDSGTRTATVAAPTAVSATDGGSCTQVTVTWTAAAGASSYTIWRSTTNDSGTATQIGTDTASPFADTTAVGGTGYFYWLKSVNACGAGAFSNGDAGSRSSIPAAPISIAASDSSSCTQVDVSWAASAGATGYSLYRNTTNSSVGASLLTTTGGLTFADSTAPEGETLFYFVTASNSCGDSAFSTGDSGMRSAAAAAPVSASTDRNDICSDDAGTITLSATGGSGTTLQWFSGSCDGAPIGTGNDLAIASPEASTTYFARWENSCGQSACVSVTLNVGTAPTAPTLATSDRTNFCADDAGNITLSATGGSGTTLVWFAEGCGGTPIGSGDGLVIASPAATTTYFARWETACSQSSCATVIVTVETAAEPPVSASSDRTGFCADDIGTISLTAVGGSGTTLIWHEGVCGGASIGSGNPLVIASPSSSTTYFAAWEGPCGVSACVSASVQVEPAPAIASVTLSGTSPYIQGTSASVTVTLASEAGASGASVSVTSSAFTPISVLIAPGSLSGSADVVLAQAGTSQTASATAATCASGSAQSSPFDVIGAASTLYVSITGDDSNSGATAGSPLRNIQTAVSRLISGGLIVIADGAYNESVVVDRSLTLSGGSAAGTIIDSNDLGSVVSVSGPYTVEIRDCTLTDGAAANGAGLDIPAGASVTLRRCEVTSCIASGSGGGIRSLGTLSVFDSTLADNSASSGGGIANEGSLLIENSTLASNSATVSGGGVSSSGGASTIRYSTIGGNSGGGVAVSGGAMSLGSSVLADSLSGADLSGAVTSNGFNVVEDATGAIGLGGTDQLGTDPLLSSLSNSGGPTRTMALNAGSVAIDAGDPACGLLADQRGTLRPLDGNGDGNAVCDVGAFELEGPTCAWIAGGCPGDFDGDFDFDSDDISAFFAEWESGGNCADADQDGDADSDDIILFFTGWDAGGC